MIRAFVSYKGNMPQILSQIRRELQAGEKMMAKVNAKIKGADVSKLKKFEPEVA